MLDRLLSKPAPEAGSEGEVGHVFEAREDVDGGERVARDGAGLEVGDECLEVWGDGVTSPVLTKAVVQLPGEVGDVVWEKEGKGFEPRVGGHGAGDESGGDVAAEDEELRGR